MEGATTSDRDELLAFELWLDEQVCEEVRRESWGRLFLTSSAARHITGQTLHVSHGALAHFA